MLERIKFFLSNNKKIILIGAAVLLIIFFVIFSIPAKKTEKPAEPAKVPGQEIAAAPSVKKTELTEEDKAKSAISILGKNFAEIYGSYSNQGNYSNIESVLPLSSSKYRIELAQALNNYRASYQPGAKYEGVTTAAMSNALESLDLKTGVASLLVKTQRKFSKDTQSNYTIKYQDIRLDLVKEGELWLVNNAKWLE
jgi:hypothetical protein